MTKLQPGFTLPEVLVVLVITTVMVIVVGGFMLRNLQTSSLASLRATTLSETERSLDVVTNDIRLSSNADDNNRWPDTNSPGGTLAPYSWASNANTIVLATAAQTTGHLILFSDPLNFVTNKNNIIYYVSGGTLYRRVLAAPVSGNAAKTTCPTAVTGCPADNVLLHNVTLFSVSYFNAQNTGVDPASARSIEIHVTTSRSLFKQAITSDYTTRMVFRND